jgi:hypothetical protein
MGEINQQRDSQQHHLPDDRLGFDCSGSSCDHGRGEVAMTFYEIIG